MTSDDDLDVFERSVVDAARKGIEPTALQRSRVRHGLAVKLATGAATVSLGSTALASLLKIGATIVLAGGLVGGYYATTKMHKRIQPPIPERKPLTAEPGPAGAESMPPEPEAMVPSAPAKGSEPAVEVRERRPSRPAGVAKPAPTDLASELAMLDEAKAALERGQARRAGEILHTYDSSFRRRLLVEERLATGVFYLCAVGQIEAARAEVGRFVARFPHSPLRQRLEHSCAGEARP